jgi:single stranded DNA-binding protein
MNGIECAFIGRVGSDLELRTSANGTLWGAINVAVGNGEDTQWVRTVVFGEVAERLASVLKKGDRLYAEGAVRLNNWIDKEGKQRAGLSVACSKAEALGKIGRSKPPKPKTTPDNTTTSEVSPVAHGASRDWQRPADAEIPF